MDARKGAIESSPFKENKVSKKLQRSSKKGISKKYSFNNELDSESIIFLMYKIITIGIRLNRSAF